MRRRSRRPEWLASRGAQSSTEPKLTPKQRRGTGRRSLRFRRPAAKAAVVICEIVITLCWSLSTHVTVQRTGQDTPAKTRLDMTQRRRMKMARVHSPAHFDVLTAWVERRPPKSKRTASGAATLFWGQFWLLWSSARAARRHSGRRERRIPNPGS